MQLEHMHDEKTVIGQNLSFMYRSNEKLAMKLEDTKDEVEFWEDQYHSREDLVFQNILSPNFPTTKVNSSVACFSGTGTGGS